MSVANFLKALMETGQVTVMPDSQGAVDSETEVILREMDRLNRLSLAATAPELLPAVAQWGARLLYHGCRFLVVRDIEAAIIRQTLQEPCPAPRSPATDYSADLALRYLPDLVNMTRQVASGDPLLQELLAIARAWPLSSVGIKDLGPVEAAGFLDDPALRQLYADRILARKDFSRLGEPRVDACLREALGAHPELCPAAAEHLKLTVKSA